MLEIKNIWLDDDIIDYWRCEACEHTWVECSGDYVDGYAIDFCPKCKDTAIDYSELELSEIKEIVRTIDGKPLWEIVEATVPLDSVINTPEIKEEILRLADLQAEFENGQWYVKVCSQSFAVVDTNMGIDFELL